MNDQFDLAPADWATLRRLLDDALERPPAERDTWLAHLDAQFDAFKPRLRALLQHASRGTGALPLDTLPKVETAQFLAERRRAADAPQAGSAVGPYRLIRPLGEGGMGEVWLAERSDMLQRRQVALKLPRLLTGRAALAERMAREREILAGLNHPNIARLYDAGLTTTGQPYLALEYVEGERIDAYCQRKALDVPARLRLVQQVARAVAHAHANLVVHRDLKPANILVTETGEVRLLDFGIAKLLDAGRAQETELTQLAGRALTPDYAAPEQILGQPIGTAADVYALGVVLFELLTGSRPYQLKRDSRAALEEAIAQAQVQRPSSVVAEARLRKQLRGDLDTIVLKALKRLPAERYSSVEALADDIERHLDQRPVRAQPDSASYRLHKFLARNRLGVSAGSAVTLALLVGAGVALWQARVAIDERQRAEEVKDFIATIFSEANPYQHGSGRALTGAELLRLAKDRLTAAPPADAATQVELLTLLGSSLLSLEDAASAEPVLAQANDEAGRALSPDHPLALRAVIQLAALASAREKPDEVRALLEPRLAALRRQQAEHPADLTAALATLAHTAATQTRFDDVDALVDEGLKVIDRHLRGRHGDRLALLVTSSRTLSQRGRGAEALRAGELAWQEAQALHPNRRHPNVADARMTYAKLLADNGRMPESIENFRAVLADTEALFGKDSRRLATRLGASAELFAEAGSIREGIDNAERARALLASHAPLRSRLDGARNEVAGLAYLYSREGETSAEHLARAEKIYVEVFGDNHWVVLVARRNLSLALTYAGRLPEAQSLLDAVQSQSKQLARDGFDANAWIAGVRERLAGRPDAALRWMQQAIASMPVEAGNQAPRVRALAERGMIELDLGRHAEARASFEEALAHHRKRGEALVAAAADAQLGLGRLDLLEGRAASALPRLQQVDAFWRDLGVDHRWAGEAAYWLARCLEALGRTADAREARDRALNILRRSTLKADKTLVQAAMAGSSRRNE